MTQKLSNCLKYLYHRENIQIMGRSRPLFQTYYTNFTTQRIYTIVYSAGIRTRDKSL